MMNADEFRAALGKLELNQSGDCGLGAFLDVGDRTARRWAVNGPPLAVAMLLRLMIARRMKPETVRAKYGA